MCASLPTALSLSVIERDHIVSVVLYPAFFIYHYIIKCRLHH